jgi:hypothetical protein
MRNLLLILLLAPATAGAFTLSLDIESVASGDKYESNGFGPFSDTIVTDKRSYSGDKSLRMAVAEDEFGWSDWGAILDLPRDLTARDEFWVSLSMYVPEDFTIKTYSNGSLKFLRLNGTNGYYDLQITNDGSSQNGVYRMILDGEQGQGWFYAGDTNERAQLFPRGRWFQVQWYVSLSPDASGGTTRLWIDGTFIAEHQGIRTLNSVGDTVDDLFFFTWWNEGSPRDQHVFLDSVTLTSETPAGRDASGRPVISAEPGAPRNIEVTSK